MRYHEELRQKEEKAKRDEQAKLRRVASSIAKEVRAFWSSVEKVTFSASFLVEISIAPKTIHDSHLKLFPTHCCTQVVQYKQQSRLEEKRKRALDLQLDFIVGQTERYSDMLSQSLQAAPVHNSDTAAVSKQSQLNAVDEDGEDWLFYCCCSDQESWKLMIKCPRKYLDTQHNIWMSLINSL